MTYSKSMQMDLVIDFLIGPTEEECKRMKLPFTPDSSNAMIDEFDIQSIASKMPSLRYGETDWFCLPIKKIVEKGVESRNEWSSSLFHDTSGLGPFTPDDIAEMGRALVSRLINRLMKYGAGQRVEACVYPNGHYGFRWR